MKMFKFLAGTCLVFSANAFACPDFSGEWNCADQEGEKWTESIVQDGKTFKITANKGTKDEVSDTVYADGRIVKESKSTGEKVGDAIHSVTLKAISVLPQKYQDAIVLAVFRPGNFKFDLMDMEVKATCAKNAVMSQAKFKVDFKVPLIVKMEFAGTGVGKETLGVDRKTKAVTRTGVVTIKGASKGETSIDTLKPMVKPQPLSPSVEKYTCTRK